jgi:TetR/AcrR family transcriptional regulator, transcriptional repressor of bet genes
MHLYCERTRRMPKQVDHQARREQITEAVYRLIAQRGFDAVSLREVAAEAGVSMGLVQHYFRTKDQMLHFALDRMRDRVAHRLQHRLANLAEPRTTKAVLRAMMLEAIPTNEESRAEACVSMAFFNRALVEPSYGDALRATYPSVLAALSRLLRHARDNDELAPDTNPEQEAVNLYALTQGLLGPLLIGHYTAQAAATAVDHHLDRLFKAA